MNNFVIYLIVWFLGWRSLKLADKVIKYFLMDLDKTSFSFIVSNSWAVLEVLARIFVIVYVWTEWR
jgi:hypothetical protein